MDYSQFSCSGKIIYDDDDYGLHFKVDANNQKTIIEECKKKNLPFKIKKSENNQVEIWIKGWK